ncbi:MAG: hypothetical protein JKY53_09300 [Flavobacteriales bacterium]|nr:hypothetical protein [Flavobacteriales bacterium]
MENKQVANSGDTQLVILPNVPQHLVGKGLSSIDYGICVAKEQQNIGKLITSSDFEQGVFLDEIGKTIMQVIGDLGVKTLPDKAAEIRIIHYITSYYKDFTLSELKKAFELAIVGELNIEIEHYNSFDIKYICKILNTYRKRRVKALEAIKRATPLLEAPKITQEQKDKIRKEFLESICRCYDDYCNDKPFAMYSLTLAYDTLCELGVLKISNAKKRKLYAKAEKRYRIQLSHPENKEQRNAFQEILTNYDKRDNSEPIKRIAKELSLMDFLNSCRVKKVDLRQKLSKIISKQTKTNQ